MPQVPVQVAEPVLPPVKTTEEVEKAMKSEWKPKFVCLAKSLDHVKRRPRDKRYMLILPVVPPPSKLPESERKDEQK